MTVNLHKLYFWVTISRDSFTLDRVNIIFISVL